MTIVHRLCQWSSCLLTCVIGSVAHIAAEEGRVRLEDISDDDSDPFEEDEEVSEEVSGSEDEVEDEEAMAKSTPKKRTPMKAGGKKSTPGRTNAGAETSEDAFLSAKMEQMELAVPTYSMEFKQPFILTTYNEGDDRMCTIHVIALTMPKENFIPEVVDVGKRLEIRMRVPGFFLDEGLIIELKSGVKGFNKNTHQAQSFKSVCEAIDEQYGMLARKPVFGHAMIIALPFVCEERVVEWEIQAYPNNMGDLTDDLGGQQFFACLTITLRMLKTKRATTGNFRVIGEVPGRMQEEE